MAEQRFCKPQVGGSIPLASSTFTLLASSRKQPRQHIDETGHGCRKEIVVWRKRLTTLALCESLLFHVEGVIRVHEIDVRMDIEIEGHIEQRGFRTVQIGRIQDLLDLRCDIPFLQFIKGFQCSENLGDDQRTRRQFDLASQGIAKECLGSLGFGRVVVGQKTEKHIGVYEEISHARPPSWLRHVSQTDESSQNLPGALTAELSL